MQLKFKNKKEAEDHAKEVLATLPSGWKYKTTKDAWSDELVYFVSFINEDINITVEEDVDKYHIYHSKEDYYTESKDILKGIAIIKQKIIARSKEILALADKL